MVGDNSTFDALILSALAITLAAKYLVGAVMSILSGPAPSPLLLKAVSITVVVGFLLALAAGGLVAGHGWSRWVAILGFVGVVALGHPTVSSPEPMLIVESAVTLIAVLYLLARNPVGADERSVDEETSASRIGSTLR